MKRMVLVVGVVALVACGKSDSGGDKLGGGAVAKKDVKKEGMSPEAKSAAAKRNSKEALFFVKKIYDGARAYYMEAGMGGGITPLPPQFPAPSQGPTPLLGACCEQEGRCAPDATLWTSEVWTALNFSVDDNHYFSYSYSVNPDTLEFTARANADLDCDGEYSTFEMRGVINSIYSDGPSGSATMTRMKELE